VGGAFWVLAGHALYWPGLVTVWHHDPSDYDHTTCHAQRWRWHVHHWRIQVLPLQQLRRRLLTRCTWCKGRHTRKDQVNISHQWDRAPGHWWQGEAGLYHRDCSLIQTAHRTCVCTEPMLLDAYPRCLRCGTSRPFGMTAQALEKQRERARIPHGLRALPAEDR
jgi:hypothetical protein